ncbi:NAD(P)-binding protein [Pleurostoma richardsiae]|uniref:NAD(P)-binding protein n=1 Tax=Pleurostoma richardsiae TaxID=41990 RepID=A0AA38REV8_9PEZI|nr:NAD(P)-binding protein [Pleurostoma richardsiae]
MKGARITAWGSPPEYIDVPDLPPPSASEIQLKMLAVGVPRVVQARAAGTHYSSKKASLPFDPSVDGIGLDEATGSMYYVATGPGSSVSLLNERANIAKTQLVKLETGVDPVSVAALVNPVASSWLALQGRAVGGCKGRTVMILGVTSASGRAAVAVAKSLGAARVVGMGRKEDALTEVQGVDTRLVIQEPFLLPSDLGPVDIILDYVGGRAGVGAMAAAEVASGENLQYIHIGDLAGEDSIVVPSSLLNGKPVRIMGSGIGSWSTQKMKEETPGLIAATAKMQRPSDVFAVNLAHVQAIWNTEDARKKRLVLTL